MHDHLIHNYEPNPERSPRGAQCTDKSRVHLAGPVSPIFAISKAYRSTNTLWMSIICKKTLVGTTTNQIYYSNMNHKLLLLNSYTLLNSNKQKNENVNNSIFALLFKKEKKYIW